jgi:hypothetical protein
MYAIEIEGLRKGRRKLARLLHERGRSPIVIPYGRDEHSHSLYLVVVVRVDESVSSNVVTIGVSGGREIAGCTCDAGKHENHCYHLSAAHPVHRTFLRIERDDVVMALIDEGRTNVQKN